MPHTTNNGPVRILLAEDDRDHADLITRALRAVVPDVHIDHVPDGEEALGYLQSRKNGAELPHLVILDLNMPKMNGHEVLEITKRDPELQVIPVVVLTTSASASDRKRAYSRYANSYLIKPMDFKGLKALAQELGHYWTVSNEPAPVGPAITGPDADGHGRSRIRA